jgi:glutaminyl-tRNA synthetase
MPTLCGLRRRGYTPSAIIRFIRQAGVSKTYSIVDIGLLEYCIRDDLNRTAPRRMAVLEPLKVVLDNYPEGQSELISLPNNPEDPEAGARQVPFSRELYIEMSDFMEEPLPKYYRLSPGREVRLMGCYFIQFQRLVRDADGNITEIHCAYDPETRDGRAPDGRKVKSTIHWVSAPHSLSCEVRLYNPLFTRDDMNDLPEGADLGDYINPDSLQVLTDCRLEPSLAGEVPGSNRFQFVRNGYFCLDARDHRPDRIICNRIVPLKDTWQKILDKT